ncbi:acetate/propionate family kinase [Roseovarius pelagicus]|uniref:Acetate kinase n=1 Tax=Roseovarius pelagicus TaxID=2980108 RepID=A0ABY6DFK4_9RHOB|nr:acetate/propionate family kinase [Roseovarius pelagicus]UXX84929.1 acetate/propionate family kinase [Roseovarius pelagicus]
MILVLNAGSSSIKFALYDQSLERVLSGIADEIGGASSLCVGSDRKLIGLPDHAAALSVILDNLPVQVGDLSAVGHRVVHGGSDLTAPCRVTPAVRDRIKANSALAPLHNPHNLAAIDRLTALVPEVPQVACFDTAFHATNPSVAVQYAVPPDVTARGIRRYGFHGLSYAGLVASVRHATGTPLPTRLLALHLGNGVSLCAIHEGKSVACTMGYSPVSGLTMGTRVGEIDANAVLRLVEEDGIDATSGLLNHESGLRGLSGGVSDMRALLAEDTEAARFAVAHFCYWVARQAGSMMAAMGGVDAIAFTGGIGENGSDIRQRILAALDWAGATLDVDANALHATVISLCDAAIPVWIIPADEERQIARHVSEVLAA